MLPTIGSTDISFDRQTYFGIGLGKTQFTPTGTDDAELQLLDDTAATAQIVLGRDFSPHFSGEFSYADLGSASLTPTTSIDYEDISLSGLLYFSPAKNFRNGLAAFTRLGIGQIETKGDTAVSRDHPVHLLAGAGIEYISNSGLAVRAEYTYHEKDAQSATINLLYRFSGTQRLPEPPLTVNSEVLREPPPVIEEPPRVIDDIVIDQNDTGDQALTAEYNSLPDATAISELPDSPELTELPDLPDLPELPNLPVIETANTDSQLATVTFTETSPGADLNPSLNSAGTPPDNTSVTYNPPATDRSLIDLSSLAPQIDDATPALESLTFVIRSSELTRESIQTLDEIATTMQQRPNLTLGVYSHTDNRGNPDENIALSKRRAVSVARYLTRNGVDISRINAIAYGGNQPIATNETIEGRRLNRRVDLEYTR